MTQAQGKDRAIIFCRRLGLPQGSAHSEIKAAFLASIYRIVSKAASMQGADDPTLERQRAKIASLCKDYLDYNRKRLDFLFGSNRPENWNQDHADAASVKVRARTLLGGVQDAAIAFVCCDMQLKVSLERVRRQIAVQGISLERANGHDLLNGSSYSYELPRQVTLMTRKSEALTAYMEKLRRVEPKGARLDALFDAQEKLMADLIGERKAREIMTDVIGALRQSDQGAVRSLIETWSRGNRRYLTWGCREKKEKWAAAKEMTELAFGYIDTNRARMCGRQGRVFLRLWELRMACEAIAREQKIAQAYVDQNSLPEKTKLDAMATLEGILTMLEELQMRSMKEAKDIQDDLFKGVDELPVVAAQGLAVV